MNSLSLLSKLGATLLVAALGLVACTDFSTREEAGICYPSEHLEDPQDCACEGPCQAGALCLDGECVCGNPCGIRECGVDACGNACGECPCGSQCFDGLCVDTSCQDRECGDDGCGLSCGVCTGEGETCTNGQCVPACTPACEGRDCGDDGCGGSCGDCGDDRTCEDGVCLGADLAVVAASFAAAADPIAADSTPAASWSIAIQNRGEIEAPSVKYQLLWAAEEAFDDEDCPSAPSDFYISRPAGVVPSLTPGETVLFGPGLWDVVPIGALSEGGELLPLPVGIWFPVVWADADQLFLEADECDNFHLGSAIIVE